MIFYVFILIFCLELTVREQLDENEFHHYYGILFESTILKLLDHSYVKVLLQQLGGTLTMEFKTTPYSCSFYGHQHKN